MSVFKEEFHFYKCLKAHISTKAEMNLFALFVTEKVNEVESEFQKNGLDTNLDVLYLFEFYTRRFVPNRGTVGPEEVIQYIDYVQERGYLCHIIKHHHFLFNIFNQFFAE